MVILPFSLLTAFLALMLKLTLNLSAFVLALPMLYIFGCGLYTLYPDYRKARDEMQELVQAQKNVERFFAEEKETTEKTPTR